MVTAPGRFLMDTPLETLLAFLHKIGVQYSISGNVPSGNRQGYFRCKIFLLEGEPGKNTVRPSARPDNRPCPSPKS